jgi:S-adenosylhomocysteine hydrolase
MMNHDLKFKVADLTLADWGRKEIGIAEKEMPSLKSIRAKYGIEQTTFNFFCVSLHCIEGRLVHDVSDHELHLFLENLYRTN